MSKLMTPKLPKPVARKDLRKKLDQVPIFTEPKLCSGKGPLESRLSRDLPGPWLAGSGPKCGTAHRNRPFITYHLVAKKTKTITGPIKRPVELRTKKKKRSVKTTSLPMR